MKVLTADRAARHLYDNISAVFDFRIWDVVAANIIRTVPAQRLHGIDLIDFDGMK